MNGSAMKQIIFTVRNKTSNKDYKISLIERKTEDHLTLLNTDIKITQRILIQAAIFECNIWNIPSIKPMLIIDLEESNVNIEQFRDLVRQIVSNEDIIKIAKSGPKDSFNCPNNLNQKYKLIAVRGKLFYPIYLSKIMHVNIQNIFK